MADTSLTFDIFARDRASSTFDKVSRSSDGLKSKLGGLVKVAAGLGGVLAGVGAAGLFKASIDEAREAAKVQRQTNAVLKSTGGIARVSSKHLGNYATRLSNIAGVDDELIQSSENVLLTFTNVRNATGKGNKIFDQGAKAALNMSAALGTDLQGATIQVGKALNDPIKGVTALSKVGVSFTKQQKEQIKALVDSGDQLGAQKIILKELGTEFGGAAAAAADPMQKLGVQFKNIEEQLGTALLPIINKLAGFLAEHLPGAIAATGRAFNRVKAAIAPIIATVKSLVTTFHAAFTEKDTFGLTGKDGLAGKAAILGKALRQVVDFVRAHFKPVMIGLGIAVAALISPWLLVVGAIAAAAAGAIYAYKHFDTFRNTLDQVAEVAMSMFTAVQAVVERVVVIATDLWNRFGDTLIGKLRIAANAINDILSGLLKIIGGIFDFIKAVMTGKWGEAWDAIKEILGGAWDAIGGILRLALDSLSAAFEAFKAVFSAVWSTMWNGLKTVLSDVFSGAADLITAPFKAAFNLIADLWNNTIGKLSFHIPDWVPKIGGKGFDVPDIPHWGGDTKWGYGGVDKTGFTAIARAGGGAVSAFKPYIVGELGPELFMPRSSGSIVPNHALGGSPSVRELHVHTQDDPHRIRLTVNQSLRDLAFLLGA